MDKKEIEQVVDKIFFNIFERKCPFTIEEIREKFAFDVKLPMQVKDSLTGEITWSEMENSKKYITQENMEKYDASKGWMVKKREVNTLEDILNIWEKVNFTTTERVYDSINVSESDTVYSCTNVYRSTDCRSSKNILFTDGCGNCENMIASQRTSNSNNCIRVDDSGTCSNSYNVICSSKITNSFFIQDCNSLYECIFCSHIANQRYCIANMQFDKDEYFEIKQIIIEWILSKT